FAAFASLDQGASWFRLNGPTLPTVAVHEFAQPTTANEIVAATHGRSLWVLDVQSLRQLKPDIYESLAELFAPSTVTRWQRDCMPEGMFTTGTRQVVAENPSQQACFDFLLCKKA